VSNLPGINKIVCVWFVLLSSIFSLAQDPSAGSTGGTPSGAFLQGSDIDNVQLNNGNLMIKIPLWSTPGRGISTGEFLIYNSKGYYMSETCSGTTCNFSVKPTRNNQLIPKLVPTPGIGTGQNTYQTSCDGGVTNIFITNGYSVIEPDGTSHRMVPDPQGSWGCQIAANATRYADDGSGWILQPGIPNKIFRKDGMLNETTDTNGNQVSSTKDTLGRTVPFGYYDASGILRTPSITTTAVSAATHLCFTPTQPSQCFEDTTLLGNAPSQITLPNGLSYSFQYDGSNVTSLTLPTGAVVSYTYTSFPNDFSGSRVASRTVTMNGQVARWTYAYAGPTAGAYTTTVIDPYNNQTVYTCVPMGPSTTPPANTVPGVPSCKITDVQNYSGTSVLLKSVHTDYWNGTLPKGNNYCVQHHIGGCVRHQRPSRNRL
jgi:hypothetical protein